MGLFLFLFLAVSVKDQTPLRSGCSAETREIAALPAGTVVQLRYSLSGESIPCYKVGVDLDGKHFDGYLPASVLDGLESFAQSRKSAGWVEVKATSAEQPKPKLDAGVKIRASAAALHANELINDNRYEEALNLLDAEIKRRPEPALFTLAGMAAWRADNNRRALEYFRKSLDMAPDPQVEGFVKALQKEFNSDQSITKLYGVRVALRFDTDAIPVETARQMIGIIDETLAQVSQQLGCPNEEKVITIAQTWEAYRASVGAVEWSGGMYDGRIRVPMDRGKGMDANSRRTLAHEATHACLSTFGRLPQWVHEGLAQKLSGASLPPAARAAIAAAAHDGKLVPLSQLSGGWGGLNSQEAGLAYAQALAAADLLLKDFGNDGVRNILRNPERIGPIAAELDKRLAQEGATPRGTLAP